MLTFSLQSGSNGCSTYVEAANVRLLFDAGIAGREAERRLAALGRDIRRVDALVLSHEHSDHVKCSGVYHRMFGIPIHATRATARAAPKAIGEIRDVRLFQAGDVLEFGPVRVETFHTPHDGADPVSFVVECAGRRLGILTDLGHPFEGLLRVIRGVDAAFLEANYDPGMLEEGRYPPHLKARIRGPQGHLSNEEAAEVARAGCRGRLRRVIASHLSEENNRPELALAALRGAVGPGVSVHLASRHEASEIFEV